MSEREDRVRLRYMLDASRQAIAFIQGRARKDLDGELQLTLALTRLVEIVGEAAKNVSDEERQRHPDVPWRAIAGTRDRLAHAYFDVDLDQLWRIVSGDLPALIPVLERALAVRTRRNEALLNSRHLTRTSDTQESTRHRRTCARARPRRGRNIIFSMRTRLAQALVVTIATCGCGQINQPPPPPPVYSVSGTVSGVAGAGVTVSLTGAASSTTNTNSAGQYTFDGLSSGTYTVSPSLAGYTFRPAQLAAVVPNGGGSNLDFFAWLTSACTVRVTGDAASGVTTGGTFGCYSGSPPAPDVAVYDPSNNVWTLETRFDTPDLFGLGGAISFYGTPSAATYSESSPGLLNGFPLCWSAQSMAGGNFDEQWIASSFSLTFTSVGPGASTTRHGTGSAYVTDFPVQGTLHAVCVPTSNSLATGTVTLDATFL